MWFTKTDFVFMRPAETASRYPLYSSRHTLATQLRGAASIAGRNVTTSKSLQAHR
jgi:hypothetical protein